MVAFDRVCALLCRRSTEYYVETQRFGNRGRRFSEPTDWCSTLASWLPDFPASDRTIAKLARKRAIREAVWRRAPSTSKVVVAGRS